MSTTQDKGLPAKYIFSNRDKGLSTKEASINPSGQRITCQVHFILERKDYLLKSFNKSQWTKDYLPSAFHPRKKGLPAKELK